jgi:hypothetical protein
LQGNGHAVARITALAAAPLRTGHSTERDRSSRSVLLAPSPGLVVAGSVSRRSNLFLMILPRQHSLGFKTRS